MTLYSDRSLLQRAAEAATVWFQEHLLDRAPVAGG
jgi:hypothetical protein